VRHRLNEARTEAERDTLLTQILDEVDHTLIEELLGAAGYHADQTSRLRSWLRHGPPLLLFVDVNTAGDLQRQLLAVALVKFQQHPDYQRAGHRCVVTYRSATRDRVAALLEQSGAYHVCDLEPLSAQQAERYLTNFRRYEAHLTHRPCPEDELHQELARLRELIARYTRDGQALISTPLLMHLVSILTGKELAQVQTLADLYAYVVRRTYDRDYRKAYPNIHKPESLTDTTSGDPYERFLTAAIRVALAMLAGGAGNTRLTGLGDLSSERVLQNLWGRPELPWVRERERWHPAEDLEFWQVGPYLRGEKHAFGDAEIRILKQLTLLHRDGDSYRFLHDSFVYFFAALAVRGWATPILKDPANYLASETHPWYRAATHRLHQEPLTWQDVGEFLGGMLEPAELRALTLEVLTAAPRDGWPALLQRLLRGRLRGSDQVLAELEQALLRYAPGLQGRPQLLGQQCYSHLHRVVDGEPSPSCGKEYRDHLLARLRGTARPWLRCLSGPAPWPFPVLAEHREWVTCLTVLPDGRVVSGGAHGQVLLAPSSGGEPRLLVKHESKVNCLAVFPNGDIVSGGEDGQVVLTDPQSSDPRRLLQAARGVYRLISLPDRRVVAGTFDGRVILLHPDTNTHRELAKHTYTVCGLGVLPAGGIVSGGNEGQVLLTQPEGGNPRVLGRQAEHAGGVTCLAVLPDGRIVSGGKDGSVLLLDPSGGNNHRLADQGGRSVICLAALPNGKVVSGGGNGVVLLIDPDGHSPRTLAIHQNEVHSLAVLPDGHVVSGGYGDLFLTDPEGGDARLVTNHGHWVSCLAVLPERRIATARCGQVLLIDLNERHAHRIPERHDKITCLMPLADGRIVTGDEGGQVLLNDSDGRRIRRLSQHDFVTCLGMLPNERVVSSGWDGRIMVSDLAGGKPRCLNHHKGGVYCIGVLPNGDLVFRGADGQILRKKPTVRKPSCLAHDCGSVPCLAVLPDGRIVFAGVDCEVSILPPTGGQPHPLGYKGEVWCLLALSDERIIAGDSSGRVSLIDLKTGNSRLLAEHGRAVRDLALLPDGRVVSGGEDGRILVINLQSGHVQPFITDSEVHAIGVSGTPTRIIAGVSPGGLLILTDEPPR
jgi:WD40 repeat protein